MSVSLPALSELAGMLMVAAPPLSVTAAEVYSPPDRVTAPVGVGLPLPSLTRTATLKVLVVNMLDEDGVAVTVGTALLTVSCTVSVAVV